MSLGNGIMLTKPVFEWLIEQLVYIEESSDELAEFYYPDLPGDRDNMKSFFMEYINKIEAVLQNIKIIDSIDKLRHVEHLNEFPFVIIGSQVILVDLATQSQDVVRIIHPLANSGHNNEITYFSTLGMALLLKETGSEILVDMPLGPKRYRIERVKLV